MTVVEFRPDIRLLRDDGSMVTVGLSAIARRTGLNEKKVRKVHCALNPEDGPFVTRPFTISWVP